MKIRYGVFVLVGIVVIIFLYNQYNSQVNAPEPILDTPTPKASIQDKIEQVLGREISDDVAKSEVSDKDASAIVTLDTNIEPNVLSVLAYLPELEEGKYLVELSNDDDKISLGFLENVKGGYLLETSTDIDTSEYSTIQITSPNSTVLQGILNL